MSIHSDSLSYCLQRYFGHAFLKRGGQFLGIPSNTLRDYASGKRPIPPRVWLALPKFGPKARLLKRDWVRRRKEKLDYWLANQEAILDNMELAMVSYAEEGRRARAARKGNQHPGS